MGFFHARAHHFFAGRPVTSRQEGFPLLFGPSFGNVLAETACFGTVCFGTAGFVTALFWEVPLPAGRAGKLWGAGPAPRNGS